MSHPKPAEIHRRNGNPSHLKLPANPVALAPVEMSHMDRDPQIILAEIVEDGAIWLGSTDALALSFLRSLIVERQEIEREIHDPRCDTNRTDLRKVTEQIWRALKDLGLTSTSRAAMGLSEVKAASTLDRLRASKASGQ